MTLEFGFLLFFCILWHVTQIGTASMDSKHAVIRRILGNYSSVSSPSSESSVTTINVTFAPIAILDLVEATQVFTFSAGLKLEWFDSRLSWDLDEFPSVYTIDVHPDVLWTPSLIIPNGADRISDIKVNLPLMIDHTGRVKGFITEVFKTNCYIDTTNYPFDHQECHIGLFSLGESLATSQDDIFDMFQMYFTGSTEWDVVNVTISEKTIAEKNYSYTLIDVAFVLKRHSIFYVLNVIFPMTLLSFMNAFVFLLPVESGEKISYLLSIFVSVSVFLNFANDSLSKSSNVSRMTYFLVSMLAESFLALIATLIILNRHHGVGLASTFKGRRSIGVSVEDKAERNPGGQTMEIKGKKERILFFFFIIMSISSLCVFLL